MYVRSAQKFAMPAMMSLILNMDPSFVIVVQRKTVHAQQWLKDHQELQAPQT